MFSDWERFNVSLRSFGEYFTGNYVELKIDIRHYCEKFIKLWCGKEDLNLHALRRQILSLVRLPVSPFPLINT